MSNFAINFQHPWFLFALLLGLVLALVPHFRIAKKYRRNRNRMVSLVLHIIVIFLSTFLLAGMTFDYTVKNDQNEILLLVDMSDSEERVEDDRNTFVDTVLSQGRYDGYRIGVVTFGFDQVYAVPFTTDVDSIYDKYIDADLPDTTGTDIAAALNYAKTLFTYPETAKIVLVTDGKETDEEAIKVIRSISASGIKIDTAYLEDSDANKVKDLQITSLTLPETHTNVGDKVEVGFSVSSTTATAISASLYDNGKLVDSENFEVNSGLNKLYMDYTFTTDGFHDVSVKIDSTTDSLEANNEYHTYIDIEVFNKVLVIEREYGDSDEMESLLTSAGYTVTVVNIVAEYDKAPTTVNDLRAYDQVILNNIANADLPEGFVDILYEYVYEYGGGLFTTGGTDSNGEANAYSKSDLYNTKLQEMLPVQAINYTPPLGVIIIIDKSGSMSTKDSTTGMSYLQLAEAGAISSLDSFSERDYVGVMTLESEYGTVLNLTPRTQEDKIISAINSIGEKTGGGTIFYDAIVRATQQLNANSRIEKKHIVLITDGMPGDGTNPETGNKKYEDEIERIYNSYGITTSVIMLGQTETGSAATQMTKAVEKGHGYLYALTEVRKVGTALRDDLAAPEIVEVNQETFNPYVSNIFSTILNGVYSASEDTGNSKTLPFTLDGFFGVKQKQGSDVIIVGEYDVPIYAQWSFGKGMVGSFMCDLTGQWSSNLLSSTEGKTLINNIVNNLMPTENIRPSDITVKVKSENLISQMSIYGNLKEGQYISGTITNMADETTVSMNTLPTDGASVLREASAYIMVACDADNGYTRCNYVLRNAGVYKIELLRMNADGTVDETFEMYQSFSYSKEYDIYLAKEDMTYEAYLAAIAEKGNGSAIADIEDPVEIFDGFITSIAKSVDPRIFFAIVIIVLFLADIAIRKFKFKWPHELIRAYKEKKNKKD